MTRNWEDWTFGLSLAAAIVVGAALSARAPTFATEAVAAEPADYVMTITAKRLPPECKSVAGARSAYCQALMNETTVTVR
jgi:hypothetical protein